MDSITLVDGVATTEGWVNVYNADPHTREYTGMAREYISRGVGLPAWAWPEVPPETAEGYVVRRTEDLSAWEVTEDLRGVKAYSKASRALTVINVPGPLDDALTSSEPETAYDVWQDNAWITDTVAQKAAQIKEAEAMRSTKLAEVNAITQVWQTQLTLGMISEANKAKLIDWMTYADQLSEVDTSLAPYVVWPDSPLS